MSLNIAIYGGGSFYTDSGSVLADLTASGFTTVTELVHLGSDGTIQLAPQILVQNGVYIGDPEWPGWLAALKQPPSSVTRLRFCVGGWDVGDFNWIRDLYDSQELGPGSGIYQNFQTLKQTIPALDGIDLDDETTYDQPSTVAFCQMLASLGYDVTFCPYERPDHWLGCLAALNGPTGEGPVSGFNLQCYAGGGANTPEQWIEAIAGQMGPGFPASSFVYPGLWCRHTDDSDFPCAAGSCPSDVATQFAAWKPSGIQGGFIWLYDDIQKCEESGKCGGPMGSADYAGAIAGGLQVRPPRRRRNPRKGPALGRLPG